MTSSVLERLLPKVSRPWVLTSLLVWSVALAVEVSHVAETVSAGPFEGTLTLMTEVFDGRYGDWAVADSELGPLILDFAHDPPAIGRGDSVKVSGDLSGAPGSASGRRYNAVLDVRKVESVTAGGGVLDRVGRSMRNGVLERLAPMDDQRGLLAGFLIGDTASIDTADVEAMRKSGLAHFVAVSGSNVGLFLLLLAVVAGPLALGPKRRAVVGLVGLPVYMAITRFEPSVMRASVMAGIALGGRLAGVILEAWQLLSVAVVVLILFDPTLASNVGFQLSVFATGGVLIGARWPAKGWLARSLAVTIGAQLAVAPLLLVHFGSVPLLSPVTNLVTGPLVAAATLVGALGLALSPLLVVASSLAGLVLSVARMAAGWPQLGAMATLLLVAMGGLALAWRPLRPYLVAVAALGLASIVVPTASLPAGVVVVLDVGQGDAILISGGDGRFALVDGGPDPVILEERLRHYGVVYLERVVLTHVHADHATGLIGIVGRIPIGEFLADVGTHETSASKRLLEAVGDSNIALRAPPIGEVIQLGTVGLKFEGPVRSYASPNDQSVVVTVVGQQKTMLLSGDIETFAQKDLDDLRADVLKVPHQGAATSDTSWLRSIGAKFAVISVGPNSFGHPADAVIETLEDSGAIVQRTDTSGDVMIDLS